MRQTENTAIVLRYANYRDYDRMLTLLSPRAAAHLEAMAPFAKRLTSAEAAALEARGRAAAALAAAPWQEKSL